MRIVGVGQAAQVERRVVGEVLGRELQVDVGDAAVAERHRARAFERAAVDVAGELRQHDARTGERDAALMFSAAMFGSSLTTLASVNVTVPFSSGRCDRSPRQELQRRVAFGAHAVGEHRDRAGVEIAVDVDVQRALADEPDLPGRGDRSRPSRSAASRSSVAAPDAMAMRRDLFLRELETVERDLQLGERHCAVRARRDRRASPRGRPRA